MRGARGRAAIGGREILWLPLVAFRSLGSSSSALRLRPCLRHEIRQGGSKKIALPPRGARGPHDAHRARAWWASFLPLAASYFFLLF